MRWANTGMNLRGAKVLSRCQASDPDTSAEAGIVILRLDKGGAMKIVRLVLLRLRPVIQARCTSVEKVYMRIASWQRCGLNGYLWRQEMS